MYIDNENRRLIAENQREHDKLEELAYLALLAIIEAPERRSPNTYSCGVDWGLIDDMRELAQKAGLNWVAASRSFHRLQKIAKLREGIERLEAHTPSDADTNAARVSRIAEKRRELAKLEELAGA